MSKRVLLLRCALLSSVAMFGSGCSTLSGLKTIGNPPPLSPVSNPTSQPGYVPVQMPMPTPQPVTYNPNSLWRTGSRAFFKDQRAHQVGDILTVKVNINDTAEFQDQTNVQRSAT
jgi:flagellar L-ring protein FlgH